MEYSNRKNKSVYLINISLKSDSYKLPLNKYKLGNKSKYYIYPSKIQTNKKKYCMVGQLFGSFK